MDNLVSIYHRGTVKRDRYEYVEFVEIQSVSVLFNEKPSYRELVEGLGRSYIAMEMMASQLRMYFT